MTKEQLVERIMRECEQDGEPVRQATQTDKKRKEG